MEGTEVTIQSKIRKFRADEKEVKKTVGFSDWMDVVIYTQGKDGEETSFTQKA
jgi:hypothetical protein